MLQLAKGALDHVAFRVVSLRVCGSGEARTDVLD
jgi:hypothetical protein